MDDDDDEVRHLYTGLCDTRGLARIMLEDWEVEHAVEDNDIGKTIPIIIYEGKEVASRPHTQVEIPTRLRRSNLRVRIYKK